MIWVKENNGLFSSEIFIPVQFCFPIPSNPFLHWQLYEPWVLRQVAFGWQVKFPSEHSSMSEIVKILWLKICWGWLQCLKYTDKEYIFRASCSFAEIEYTCASTSMSTISSSTFAFIRTWSVWTSRIQMTFVGGLLRTFINIWIICKI